MERQANMIENYQLAVGAIWDMLPVREDGFFDFEAQISVARVAPIVNQSPAFWQQPGAVKELLSKLWVN